MNLVLFVIKKIYYIFFSILLLASCTSSKNTRGTRFYHALNTRYNIYFNGKEAYNEALKAQLQGYKEDYSDFIYMYPTSSLPKNKETIGGPFDRTIEKSAKAIKQHSIKAKPKKKPGKSRDAEYQKYLNREEYNPFLYHSWLIMGKAQFHNGDFLTASGTFSYISRHYINDDPKISYEAKIWQARCYSEMEWFYEAEDILRKVNNEKLPSQLNNLFSSVYADYLIKVKTYQDALPYLDIAIRAEKNKTQKNRMKYLSGQIYTYLGNDAAAYKVFSEVAGSSAPYPLTFSAQIRETETYKFGDTKKIIGKLKKMSKSSKNAEYLDQVYYALGNVYLSIPDTTNAVESYKTGAEKSVAGGMDKALCLIKLGDIYFRKKNYVQAQPCYSGALGVIKKEYKDYERVSKRSEVLGELVINYESVTLQDSLQRLAAMPEKERMAVIDKIIEGVKKAEKEAKEKADKEEFMANRIEDLPDLTPIGRKPSGGIPAPTMLGDNSFYFYNVQSVNIGKTNFQSKWGRRKLEDNWRRRNKIVSGFEENESTAEVQNESIQDTSKIMSETPEVPGDLSTDTKDPKFYLQQIPLTEEDINASNVIIKDGLYNMGLIYKDKLEDMPLAIETFNQLINRFPDNEFLMETYYHLYLIYLRLDDKEMADLYKNKIKSEFPKSDYAVAMADPNYEYNIRMMDVVQDSIYEKTYNDYLSGNASSVRKNYDLVREKYTQSKLMPKFMFLNALSYVQTGQQEEFKTYLKELLEKYPDADVSVLAGDILKGFSKGRKLGDSAPMKGMMFNIYFGASEDGTFQPDSTLKFSQEMNTPYTMMLIYPSKKINENLLLFDVAAYNFGNFMIKEFDLVFETFGDISMLQIQGFSNYEEIMQYYKMIHEPEGYAKSIDPQIIIMPISIDNYGVLMKGKSLQEYIDFFESHFGENNKSMIGQWKARQKEEEIKEVEKSLEEPEKSTISVSPPGMEKDTITIPEKQPEIKPVVIDSTKIIQPKPEEKQDTAFVPRPVITEQQLEEGVNKAAGTIYEGSEKVSRSLNEFSNDPIRSIMGVFSKKKKKNAIDEYVEQQQKEEKAQQKELKEKQKAEEKAKYEEQKRLEEERKNAIKKQEEEEKAILKAKEAQEKELERLKQSEIKQKENEKKQKAKEKEEARKQKEKEYKLLQKQKENERKEKERLREEDRKKKEAERKALQKKKEEERKAKEKQRESGKK